MRAGWVALAGGLVLAGCGAGGDAGRADPADRAQVVAGERVYVAHCASCHGANLQGQTEWRRRRADGRLPAPPHDDSGHTWHHPDAVLFAIVRNGLVPPHAPAGYASDMPAYAGVLSDAEIWSVLAFIKSRWSARSLAAQAEITAARGR